jgi:hypothetical protein
MLGSLLLGVYFDKCLTLDSILDPLNLAETKDLILVVIGGGVLILVTGYIIGTITITLLRLIFIFNKGTYEINLKQDFDDIGEIILKDASEKIKNKEKLYALVTYDHEFLPDNIHKWIQRRWTAFHTSANAATSLLLSIIVGQCIGIQILTWWIVVLGILTIIYIYHSYRARRETIDMINFQTKIRTEK